MPSASADSHRPPSAVELPSRTRKGSLEAYPRYILSVQCIFVASIVSALLCSLPHQRRSVEAVSATGRPSVASDSVLEAFVVMSIGLCSDVATLHPAISMFFDICPLTSSRAGSARRNQSLCCCSDFHNIIYRAQARLGVATSSKLPKPCGKAHATDTETLGLAQADCAASTIWIWPLIFIRSRWNSISSWTFCLRRANMLSIGKLEPRTGL